MTRLSRNLVACLATLHGALGLDSHTLRFHKEDPKTTHKDCPGDNIFPRRGLIQAVHEMIAGRNDGEHQITGTPS